MTHSNGTQAKDIMKSPVVILDAEMTIQEAASILSESNISGAPVTDHRGKVVGVVSLFDIVTYLAGLERPPGEPGGFYRYSYPISDTTEEDWGEEDQETSPAKSVSIGEIMTPEVIGVAPEMTIPQLAALMRDRHIHRVFVTDKDVLIGVISTMDVLGTMAERSVSARTS